MDGPLDTERMKSSGESWLTKAWEALRQSLVNFRGQPVGTIAASANSSEELTYDQVYYNEPKQKYSVDETWGNPPALTSDSDSWMMKSAKRRKLDSHTHTPPSSVTRIVTVKTTFNDDVIKFNFPISSGLLNLKNIVAQKFDLKSNRFCLKYIDKEKDLILIAIDEDLKLAVNTTAVNNCISLIICLPDGVCAQNRVEVIPPTLEFVADNFTSDSESLVLSTGEKTHQGKKRKPESGLLLPVTGWVTAKITYKKYMKVFPFCISSGVTKLENRVARSFKLKGKKLRLKYWDEDDDLIWVSCDEDLKLAVVDTVINNTINLICLPD